MEIKEYIDIIEKTAIYPKSFGLGYCALGLNDELSEFIDELEDPNSTQKKMNKEAGDVYWYITALALEVRLSPKHILSSAKTSQLDSIDEITEEVFEDLKKKSLKVAGSINGTVKKYYRDPETEQEKEDYLEEISDSVYLKLCQVSVMVSEMCRYKGIKLEDILEANYNKLIKRRETDTIKGSGSDREEKV